MGWKELSVVDQRRLLVSLSQCPDANLSELAARFGVSRKTLYKWRKRAELADRDVEGAWAADHSRRPASCPWRTSSQTERRVIELRHEHPCWGPRKLRKLLQTSSAPGPLPSVSTISAILKRAGLIEPEESLKRREFTRFEAAAPNLMWQMDFKGPFRYAQGRCHPLTVVDDHSRYALGVTALAGESSEVTRPAVIEIFRRYGIPQTMLLDNGSCWGLGDGIYTEFSAWLVRLGIRVSFGRPYHPQTRGKNERFNRTLKEEAIAGRWYSCMQQCQEEFNEFMLRYNCVRPHEALEMDVPANRYTLSPRIYPERLAPIDYPDADIVRKVGPAGYLSLSKERYHVGRAFSGQPVAMRATNVDGIFDVYFCHQRVAVIDRREGKCVQKKC
jgi:transposase InsO family protein